MAYQITGACRCCGKCLRHCPAGAISKNSPQYQIDPGKCVNCGTCAEVCPAKAISVSGSAAQAPNAVTTAYSHSRTGRRHHRRGRSHHHHKPGSWLGRLMHTLFHKLKS